MRGVKVQRRRAQKREKELTPRKRVRERERIPAKRKERREAEAEKKPRKKRSKNNLKYFLPPKFEKTDFKTV